MYDAGGPQELFKFLWEVLSSIVWSEALNGSRMFVLGIGFVSLEVVEHFRLMFHQVEGTIASIDINEGANVFFPVDSRYVYRTTHVWNNKFKWWAKFSGRVVKH